MGLDVGAAVDVGSADGSTHIRPNHSLEVQEVAVVWVGITVVGKVGGEVMEWDEVVLLAVVVSSLQPQTAPGVLQVVDGIFVEEAVVVVGSLQPPKNPGCSHVVVGTIVEVIVVLVVDSSLQPNHPGVLQVVVVIVVVVKLRVEVVAPVVVDSSRQPHQPGVAQV